MLHIIEYHDIHGRVALREFLRLAGLVAADAADVDDLATEFARNEVTLHLEPEELADTDAYGWYCSSFDGYKAWEAARDARTVDGRDALEGKALVAYRGMFEDAAHALRLIAAEAAGDVREIAPVIPLRSLR